MWCMEPLPATLGILTRNSAGTIRRALASARGFTDIIVCDGGSTDGTLDIVREFGGRVIEQDARFRDKDGRLRDYAGVRNQVIAASDGWIFFLDADEMLTPPLLTEIKIIATSQPPGAFWVPRHYVRQGREIQCATTYPSRQMRFFHKTAVEGYVRAIHEKVVVRPGCRVRCGGSSDVRPDRLWPSPSTCSPAPDRPGPVPRPRRRATATLPQSRANRPGSRGSRR